MTTCITEIPLAGEPVTACPIVASEDSWDRGPCPMTGQNNCPSDPNQQAKCPQC